MGLRFEFIRNTLWHIYYTPARCVTSTTSFFDADSKLSLWWLTSVSMCAFPSVVVRRLFLCVVSACVPVREGLCAHS